MIRVIVFLALFWVIPSASSKAVIDAPLEMCPSVKVDFKRWASLDGWRVGVFEVENSSGSYIRYPVSQPRAELPPLLSIHRSSLFTRKKGSVVWNEILTMGSSRVPDAMLLVKPHSSAEITVSLERAFYEDDHSGGGFFIELFNGLVSCRSRSTAMSLERS